jgi:FkbM family methyltransferase
MDYLFQAICNVFPHYIVGKNKFNKKIYYFIFSIFKIFLKGPFVIKFKNFKFYCYPGKNDYSRYVFTRGEMPDPFEINFFKSIVENKDSVFLDCGANCGFYSIPIASSNKNCQVIAFEPSNIEYQKIKKNIKLNSLKNITVNKLAVSNKVQNLIFREEGKTIQSFSTGGGHIVNKISNKNLDYKVKATTIDSYLKKFPISKSKKMIMKFDLEGHDLIAIYGAVKTIKKYNPIILFEFSKMIINNPDYSKEVFNKFLKKNKLIISNLRKKIYSINDLHRDILGLGPNHDTIGNFILTTKNNLKTIKAPS